MFRQGTSSAHANEETLKVQANGFSIRLSVTPSRPSHCSRTLDWMNCRVWGGIVVSVVYVAGMSRIQFDADNFTYICVLGIPQKA